MVQAQIFVNIAGRGGKVNRNKGKDLYGVAMFAQPLF
jgi:hypothetical protein